MATSRRSRAGRGGRVAEDEQQDSGSRQGSSRREAAAGSRRGKAGGSSRRGNAKSKSGRGGKSGKSGKGRAAKGSKRAAAAEAGGDGTTRRGRTPRKDSKMGTIVTITVAVLLIAGITFAIMWPGIQRGMVLDRLDAAEDFEAAQPIADEFMTLAAEEHDGDTIVSLAITEERGSVEAQIYLAVQTELPIDLVGIAKRRSEGITDQQRAEALQAAVALLRQNERPPNIPIVPSLLLDWIKQEEREERNRDLAIAALDFLGVTKQDVLGDDPAKIIAAVVLDTERDPKVIDTAVDNLSRVTGSHNVGFALALLKSANADKVIDHGQTVAPPPGVSPLIDKITNSVTPAVLDRIFELLEHEDPRIQAAGVAFLKGPRLANIDPSQREDIGRRIGSYITPAIRSEKPAIFSEALESAVALRLSGARNDVLALMAEVPASDPDAEVIADALGRAFILDGPENKEANEQILRALAEKVDDDATRTIAAKAIGNVREKGLTSLRLCLEACIKHGTDPDCFAAAQHIVKDLYGRGDVIAELGDDLNAWVDFLAKDKPRFDHFAETEAWLTEAEKHIRAMDDQEMLRANRVRCLKEKEEFEQWNVAPLGLEMHQIKELKRRLGIFSQSVSKAIH